MKFSYNWLRTYFDTDLPSPDKLDEAVGLHAFESEGFETISDDTILDFDVLPNRAHDCLCHRGLAREIGTILNQTTIEAPDHYQETNKNTSPLSVSVDIKSPDKCRRYIGKVIQNIEVGESPDWLKQRLEAIGQRSINNVVDATNYVMFDLGQPLHAFDYDKLTGEDKHIIVRNADDGEAMTTLSGEELSLTSEDLVIADSEQVLALAGVKGGKAAEVDQRTMNILLEAANFEPVSTRQSSRRNKLQTDSSKRFENEITAELASEAIEAVANLIVQIAGTDNTLVGSATDAYPNPPGDERLVQVSVSDINKRLGTELSKAEVGSIFNRLGFHITIDDDLFSVRIPHARLDLAIPEDLVEEVGRIYGYANIETVLPDLSPAPAHKTFYYETLLRQLLNSLGFMEIRGYTFTDTGEVHMANALASDKDYLRTNLYDGMADALERNLYNSPLFGLDEVKVFEIGRVFTGENESLHLCFGILSTNKKKQLDITTVVTQLETTLDTKLEASLKNNIAEINLDNALSKLPNVSTYNDLNLQHETDDRTFHQFSNYPFVLRDIAVWLPDGVEPSQLIGIIQSESGELLATEPRLVDEYPKDGRTSYAYRIVFQSMDKTLSDVEVNEIMDHITASIEQNDDWEVR
jgi:phenylalanyl-tRNA synthetase beta chain